MALCIKPRISLFRYVPEQTRHRGVRLPHRVPLAEASTNGNFQTLPLPPGTMPTKPVSPSTDLDGAMESGKYKLYALADGCEGRLMRNEAKGRGKEIGANYDTESSHYEPRQLGGADSNRASSLVGNEAKFSEAIHKQTHSGSSCANHFRQLFLMNCRNDQLRFASVAEVT